MTNSKILPFAALHYNPAKITDLAAVITPPYDVISPEMQAEFYERSPYNFVRLDLAKEPGDERYAAAQKSFLDWVRLHILEKDDKPAIYFHHQTFTLPSGQKITRKGFFAVRKIEDFSEGGIKPHEKTLEGPKADRLKLTKALKAHLSPVFSLYSDPEKKVDHLALRLFDSKPYYDYTSKDGERHQVWKEQDPIVCKLIGEALQEKPVFIADGHHRYETSLNYRNECRAKNPSATGTEPYNYVLMYFSNMDDDGLIILPIHRALHNIKNFSIADLTKRLESHFKVLPVGNLSAAEMTARLAKEGVDSHAFMMVTKDPNQSFLLTLKRKEWLSSPVSAAVSKAVVDLDVTVLHRLVFEEILRISQEAQANQENIIYWKDTNKAVKETREGACDVTFLLNPTRIDEMRKVALAGEKMPQKSTYFYPKVPSGLVIYPV